MDRSVLIWSWHEPRGAEPGDVGAAVAAGAGERAGDPGDRAPRRDAGAGAERGVCGGVVAGRGVPGRGVGRADDRSQGGADLVDAGDDPPGDGAGLPGAAAGHAAGAGTELGGVAVRPEPGRGGLRRAADTGAHTAGRAADDAGGV